MMKLKSIVVAIATVGCVFSSFAQAQLFPTSPITVDLELDQKHIWPGEDLVFDIILENPTDEDFSYTFPTSRTYTYSVDMWYSATRLYYFQVLTPFYLAAGDTSSNKVVYDPYDAYWLDEGSHTAIGMFLGATSGAHSFTVDVPNFSPTTKFMNFGSATSDYCGDSYRNWELKFYRYGRVKPVYFRYAPSPNNIDDNPFYGRPIYSETHPCNFDTIAFYGNIKAISFIMVASQAGDITVTSSAGTQTITASERGYTERVYIQGALSEISFSGAAFDGIDNVLISYSRKPGDANGDNKVDLDDFIILKQRYGETMNSLNPLSLEELRDIPDVNGDGVINLDDAVYYKQNYDARILHDCYASGDFDGDGKIDLDDFVILKQSYGS